MEYLVEELGWSFSSFSIYDPATNLATDLLLKGDDDEFWDYSTPFTLLDPIEKPYRVLLPAEFMYGKESPRVGR